MKVFVPNILFHNDLVLINFKSYWFLMRLKLSLKWGSILCGYEPKPNLFLKSIAMKIEQMDIYNPQICLKNFPK